MEIYVQWLDDKYVGKVVNVIDVYVREISGHDAMNILFNQESDQQNKDNYLTVLYDRTDINVKVCVGHSCLMLNTFAADNFVWYTIDKEYLYEVLKKMNVEFKNDKIHISESCYIQLVTHVVDMNHNMYWEIFKDGAVRGEYDILDYTLQEVVDRALYLV